MRRTERLFDIIQYLRRTARPVTAAELAQMLEVSERTIYRDIAALQAARTPIEGEAGIGYILRPSYDLPPLNFDVEELEAITVGLSLLARTGDDALNSAAARVSGKIEAMQESLTGLKVSDWGIDDQSQSLGVDPSLVRQAIREERKLRFTYQSLDDRETFRTVQPIAIVYYISVIVVTAWCELREDFRHFRLDRISDCDLLDDNFTGEGAALRRAWEAFIEERRYKDASLAFRREER